MRREQITPAETRTPDVLTVFHAGEVGGPARTLQLTLAPLAERFNLEFVFPTGRADAAKLFEEIASLRTLDYGALMGPGGSMGLLRAAECLTRDVRTFRAHIRSAHPDLVICVTAVLPAVLIAARLEDVPSILHANELLADRNARSHGKLFGGKLLLRLDGLLATSVVACSEAVARQYRGHRGGAVEIVYPPVGEDCEGGDRTGFRARHGIGEEEHCVATVGNITPGRGQDVLLRAMTKIRQAFPKTRCLIAGVPFERPKDLEFNGQLERIISDLQLDESVVRCGFVDRIADLYAAADVVVHPVRHAEAFGRVPFEALRAGRPVVVSRVGAIPELLRDRETAVLVPPEDPDALANAVVAVLGDRDLASNMVRRGRRLVHSRLDPRQGVARLSALLDAMTRRP